MSDKDYIFREADETDLQGIAELFSRHDYGAKNLDWLRWKYFDNPEGTARIFIAEDSDNKIVGLVAYLPRRFTSAESGTFSVMQSVDVFVAEEQRKKGLFSKISRFARSNTNVPKIGFPNKFSINFGLRSGWKILAHLERWGFPVAVGSLIAKKSFSLVAPLADMLSKVYAVMWLWGYPRDLKMKPITRFDKDFVVDSNLIHGIRSADYLNWRFINNPMETYSAYEFFEGKESIGYCVYIVDGSSAAIYDFVTNRRRRNCLRLFVEHCRGKRITYLSFVGVSLRLRRLGFLLRRDSAKAFMTYNLPEKIWMITMCDSDW